MVYVCIEDTIGLLWGTLPVGDSLWLVDKAVYMLHACG